MWNAYTFQYNIIILDIEFIICAQFKKNIKMFIHLFIFIIFKQLKIP